MQLPPAETLVEALLSGLRPDSKMTVSQWAEERRILSAEGSATPGKWRNAITPYLVEIMDALSPSCPTQEVVFVKGTQIGGSECGFNWIGACVDLWPAPMMIVLPTQPLAIRSMSQRVEPMLTEVPSIAEKMQQRKDDKGGKAVDSKLQKDFPSGTLVMSSATSKSAHRSMACKYVYFDEVDAYPIIPGEGHPTTLFKKRSATFSRRKLFYCSTPTVKEQSQIEAEFLDSTREYYHVPCPHCEALQVLKFENLKWETGRPETVRYECSKCQKPITNAHKRKMLRLGKWIPENPNHKKRGFHLSGLYSPFPGGSWSECVTEYETAKKDREKMRTFVNTWLGETFEEEEGQVPPWRHIYARREAFRIGEVPARALVLTGAVDVQRDRLELLVVGWNRSESFVIDYQVFSGDTSNPFDKAPYRNLIQFLNKGYKHASGQTLQVEKIGIDTSDNTSHLYEFVRKNRPRLFPLKGFDLMSLPAAYGGECQIKTSSGKKVGTGMKLVKVGTSVLKEEVYNRLNLDVPTSEDLERDGWPLTWIHIPEFNEDFFQMLCSEKKVAIFDKRKNRITKHVWKKIHERNEILDLVVYNHACAHLLKLPGKKDGWWKKLEIELGVEAEAKKEVPELKKKKAKKKATKKREKRRSFLD